MIYHSEPYTRRYVAKVKKWQIMSRLGSDSATKEYEAQAFRENWEKISEDTASQDERVEYFSLCEELHKKLLIGLSVLFLICIPLRLQWYLGAWAGLLLFPLMTAFSLWIGFRVRLKRANANHSSPAVFTTRDLVNRLLLALTYTLTSTLMLYLILVSSDEIWVD